MTILCSEIRHQSEVIKHNDKPFVFVSFEEELTTDEVVEKLSSCINPNIILWYIGCYGLREQGVKFYKDKIISPILNRNQGAIFSLVDLTAWSAFRDARISLDKANSCSTVLESFNFIRIQCIRSSEIFKRLKEIDDPDILEYFSTALCREFILASSAMVEDSEITIGKIFSKNCKIIADRYEQDANKCYSLLQYMEGCLLIEKIYTKMANKFDGDLEIRFVLPNDEWKYYKDDKNSFARDVQFLLSKTCSKLNAAVSRVNVKFLCFKYGSKICERPYNARGKVIKSSNLRFNDVVNELTNIQFYKSGDCSNDISK